MRFYLLILNLLHLGFDTNKQLKNLCLFVGSRQCIGTSKRKSVAFQIRHDFVLNLFAPLIPTTRFIFWESYKLRTTITEDSGYCMSYMLLILSPFVFAVNISTNLKVKKKGQRKYVKRNKSRKTSETKNKASRRLLVGKILHVTALHLHIPGYNLYV